MMNRKRCLLLALLMLSLALTACRSPQTCFYTLTSVVDPGVNIQAHSPLTIGIGPVSIAGYIDRPEIVIRESPYAVRLRDFRQWAEPLANGLPAVLLQNIANLLPGDRVDAFPQATPSPLDYRVQVDFTRFDVSKSGQATLAARWQIFDGKTGQLAFSRTSTVSEQAADTSADAAVAALSRTVGKLAVEIAEQVAMLAASSTS